MWPGFSLSISGHCQSVALLPYSTSCPPAPTPLPSLTQHCAWPSSAPSPISVWPPSSLHWRTSNSTYLHCRQMTRSSDGAIVGWPRLITTIKVSPQHSGLNNVLHLALRHYTDTYLQCYRHSRALCNAAARCLFPGESGTCSPCTNAERSRVRICLSCAEKRTHARVPQDYAQGKVFLFFLFIWGNVHNLQTPTGHSEIWVIQKHIHRWRTVKITFIVIYCHFLRINPTPSRYGCN